MTADHCDSSDRTRTSSLKQSVKAVLLLQCVATGGLLIVTLIYGLFFATGSLPEIFGHLVAAAYGAILAIVATALTARSVRRASPVGEDKVVAGQAPVSLLPIFSGLLNKLVIVGGGIGFGLIVWNLNPIFVVLSYLVVQIAAAGQLMQNNP